MFSVLGGFTTRTPINTDEINDIGLNPLHNVTGRSVRLVSVTFASKHAEVHVVNVLAYNYLQTKELVTGGEGDLYKECPRYFHPHPISSFVTPPHADTNWFVEIAYTISKPGTYYLGRVRISYTTDGRQGWQYQNINDTIVVHNPPMPGPRPLPASAVCP